AGEQASSPAAPADTEANEKPAKKPGAKKPPQAAAAGDGADGDKPAPKAKKEKPPALEDKPFTDFIQQDFLPALKEGLTQQGIQEVELTFEKQKIGVVSFSNAPECWQIMGRWKSDRRGSRQFNIYFLSDNIQGQKAFSYVEGGSRPSTLESFLIDERKVSLALLVSGALQRLNAQKWLVRN
ncbi:MAG: DUF2996 domain-containing protein, partial [Kovacikia sp.]